MRAFLLGLLAATALGCGGAANTGSTTPPAAGAALKLAGTAPVPEGDEAFGPAFSRDGASVLFASGGKLRRFDPVTLAERDARPTSTVARLGAPAVVLHGVAEGDAAFEVQTATRVVIPPPPGSDCGPPSLSADAGRLSRNCATDEDTVVIVQDTRTGDVIAKLAELETASPVRAGEITDGGSFVLWRARASGAFEEIQSKLVGPAYSSRAVMSPDQTLVFTVSDKDWMPDDRTPAEVVDRKTGKVRYTLPFDVERVAFSPDSRRFAAVRMGGEDERKITAITIHRTDDGAQVGTLPDRDAELIVFSPDARALVVRGGGQLRLYTGVP